VGSLRHAISLAACLDIQRDHALKVLALTRYGRLGASSRMRLYQYVPVWSALGIEVQVSPLLSDDYLKRLYSRQATNWFDILHDYLTRALTLLRARKFDLVWIEKELFPNLPAWFEQALGALNIRYVVDYDDAVFHNYDLAPHLAKRFLANKIDKVMRSSALVICGNAYLAERSRSTGVRRVEIIPTVIDLDRYGVLTPVPKKHIVVGWIGSPSTVKYLQAVVPALEALAMEFPVQLRVIGAQFFAPGLYVDCRPWSEESEVIEIQDFDIGIMPLTDSLWERGKCGYKLIQYMACGLPVVASPVGVNREIVRHGANGYLASSVDEWVDAFRALFSNSQNRFAMGVEGRLSVEKTYCLQVTGPRLAKLFHEVVAEGVD
jgi:glycosyltransferase involved in cell wall biosynthesis